MNRELKDIIKLSGVKLDEEWANTPEATNLPDQEEMGDLRDWGTNVELSLRKYLNHNLASPEFPQPITEKEMTASYKTFVNEVHEEIVEKAKDEEAEEVEEAKEEDADEDAEEVTEAQSPAQKAAFQKMLDAKNGKKEETDDDNDDEDDEVSEALEKIGSYESKSEEQNIAVEAGDSMDEPDEEVEENESIEYLKKMAGIGSGARSNHGIYEGEQGYQITPRSIVARQMRKLQDIAKLDK